MAIGIIIGVVLVEYNIMPEVLDFFVDSGGVENSITFTGNSARNPDMSEKDVKDVSDNGNDADGNTTDEPTFPL